MKPIVAFVAALVVGTAASTGAKYAIAKPQPPHADSTAAHDSTGADSAAAGEHGDTAVVASGEESHAPADTMPKAPVAMKDTTVHAPDAKAVVEQAKAVGVPPKTSDAAKAVTDSIVDASERRIAKVFTAMDPKQAAKVLEHMSDNDVQIILGYVGPRPAAAIMAELPPERVAILSKLAMQGKKP